MFGFLKVNLKVEKTDVSTHRSTQPSFHRNQRTITVLGEMSTAYRVYTDSLRADDMDNRTKENMGERFAARVKAHLENGIKTAKQDNVSFFYIFNDFRESLTNFGKGLIPFLNAAIKSIVEEAKPEHQTFIEDYNREAALSRQLHHRSTYPQLYKSLEQFKTQLDKKDVIVHGDTKKVKGYESDIRELHIKAARLPVDGARKINIQILAVEQKMQSEIKSSLMSQLEKARKTHDTNEETRLKKEITRMNEEAAKINENQRTILAEIQKTGGDLEDESVRALVPSSVFASLRKASTQTPAKEPTAPATPVATTTIQEIDLLTAPKRRMS